MTVLNGGVRHRHFIVTVTVTEKRTPSSGFLAGVTVMTLVTVDCGRFLEGGYAR